MASEEYAKMVAQLRERLDLRPDDIVLQSPLGPIKVDNLSLLEGWRWNLYSIGYPGVQPTLIRGGAAVTLVDYTDELGWIINFGAGFRSPFGTLNFTADAWSFSASPFFANLQNPVNTNLSLRCPIYNPFTPLGPIYAILFDPVMPCPYSRRVQITLSLPSAVPVATTTVFSASVGKIHIADYDAFIRSVKRFTIEEMTGKKLVGYP